MLTVVDISSHLLSINKDSRCFKIAIMLNKKTVFIEGTSKTKLLKDHSRGTWGARLVRHLGSGCGLRILGFSCTLDSEFSGESARDSLSLYPPRPLFCTPQ